MKEWGRLHERPQNKEELFNLRHAMLRNVIERIFGLAKKHSRQHELHSFPFPIQTKLALCSFMIHNFIHLNNNYEDEFDELDGDTYLNRRRDLPDEDDVAGVDDDENVKHWRDSIASEMWRDYRIVVRIGHRNN